jgi:hypothetical protein
MKKTIAIVMLGLLLAVLTTSKDSSAGEQSEISVEIEQAMQEVSLELEAAMQEIEMELGSDPDINIMLGLRSKDSRTPKMGVYLSDMTFKRAWEMHYPYCHGVLISGTTSEGAARKAGLMDDDIIIEFDGVPVRHEDHLVSLIQSHAIGESVPLKYFRFGEEGTTAVVLQTAGGDVTPIEEIVDIEEVAPLKIKKRAGVGTGGGSWYPVWYTPDFTDINAVLTGLEFRELREEGILLNGGGGKGNIGNGWMLGGMGAGYTMDRSINTTVGPNNDINVIRRMRYSFGYGGVTLDKRFPLFRKITPSVGFMLGWGGVNLEVDQTQGNYDWNNLPGVMNNNYNSHVELHKDYILFQPKATILWRFTDWLGIQVEGGYLFSYSWNTGWDTKVVNDNFEVENSPETSLDGYTITIGPWFGF